MIWKGIGPGGLLILARLNATLAILVEFFAIGAKTVFTQGLSHLSHELEVVGQIVDGIELGAQNLIRLLEVV